MGRVGVLQHGLPPLDVAFEYGPLVQEIGLRRGAGLAGYGHGELVDKAYPLGPYT